MDIPTCHKVVMVTDAAINIASRLGDRIDTCQNAIDLAVSLGRKNPKVAILAAVVNPKIPADAANVVLGARVPIILTSRADSVRSRDRDSCGGRSGRSCAEAEIG